ncbi:MAG: PAS domain S-box protein [Halioglobus sp.]|nr:PAS domain S-box protein [Halioglobus sp.]
MNKKAKLLRENVLRTLGVAFLYLTAVELSYLLALGPYKVAFYWPASGVAIAAVLLFKKRAVFGVALGAIVAIAFQFIRAPEELTAGTALVAAVTIAAWTAQPLIALNLFRRFAPFMPFWERGGTLYRGIGILLVVSLIPASVGACALYVSGTIPGSDIIRTWALWSIGDFLGMLTITPVVWRIARFFGVGPETPSVGPIYSVIMLSITVLVSLVTFATVSNSEQQAFRKVLDQAATDVASRFELLITKAAKDVGAVAAFFASSPSISVTEYKSFFLALTKQKDFSPGLQSLSWVPRFAPTYSPETGYKDPLSATRIEKLYTLDSLGNRTLAAQSDVYFPIDFIQPSKGNDTAIGYDLGSKEIFRKAFNRANRTKQGSTLVHFDPVPWLQSEPALALVQAVYRPQEELRPADSSNALPTGYVVAEYLLQRMLEGAQFSNEHGMEIFVFSLNSGGIEKLLWMNSLAASNHHEDDGATISHSIQKAGEMRYGTTTKTFPATNLIVITRPGPEFLEPLRTMRPWWISAAIMFGGFAITYLIFLYEKRSLERLRAITLRDAIVVSARQPFVHLDENGIVLEWNNAAHEVFGWTLEQVLHRKLTETLIPARYHEAHSNGMQRFKTTGTGPVIGNTVSIEACCSDSTELPVDLLINAVQVDDGWHFFAFVNDITARKAAEDTLKKAHDKYTALFQAIPDAIIIFNEDGDIENVNDAAVELFGWSREEMLSKSYKDIIAERSEAHLATMYKKDAYSVFWPGDDSLVFAKRQDGSEFPFEAIVNLQKTERGLTFVSLVRDVTKVLELQDVRDSKRKLETLGELTGVLAHEFNNLLAIIIGNLELLRDGTADTKIDGTMRDRLNVAHDAAMRGTGVVKSLSAVATDQPMPLSRFDCVPMLTEMLPMFLSEAGEDIHLGIETEEKALLVDADYNFLSEALRNLVINARESIAGKGEIRISLERTHSSAINDPQLALLSGGYAVISVSDTGHGMKADDLEQAFDPFFSTKKNRGNKGLGLSMVSRMAKQFGGVATVASKRGEGTLVRVYLPTIDSDVVPARVTHAGPVGEGQYVLVVDDQKDFLTLAVSWLEKSGYSVKSTDKPKVALEIIESSVASIDLLITDMHMPTMDGVSLSQFAREVNPHVEVLYITGFFDHSVKRSADNVDFPVLEKPFRKDEFLTAVRSILDAAKTKKPS